MAIFKLGQNSGILTRFGKIGKSEKSDYRDGPEIGFAAIFRPKMGQKRGINVPFWPILGRKIAAKPISGRKTGQKSRFCTWSSILRLQVCTFQLFAEKAGKKGWLLRPFSHFLRVIPEVCDAHIILI